MNGASSRKEAKKIMIVISNNYPFKFSFDDWNLLDMNNAIKNDLQMFEIEIGHS